MAKSKTKKNKPAGYKPGEWLEKVVSIIESQLLHAQAHDAKIESPAKLIDKKTGDLRQHDVVITYRLSQYPIVIAIECKDRSRAIDVDKIEAFKTKCDDTGVNQGVMISANGFTEGAIIKARAYNIRLLDIHDVEKLDWIANTDMPIVGRQLVSNNLIVDIEGNRIEEVCRPIIFAFEDGDVMSGDDISIATTAALEEFPIDEDLQHPADTVLERRMPITLPRVLKIIDAHGSDYGIAAAAVICQYQVINRRVPIFLYRYVTSDDQAPVSTAALAQLNIADMNILLSMVGPEGGEKHIAMRLDSDASKVKQGR